MDIDTVLAQHQDRLMALPDVTGVGIGERGGRPTIVVMARQLTRALRTALPAQLDGHPVVVEEIGEVTAFGDDAPAPPA